MSFLPERDDTLFIACFGPGFGESIVIRVPPDNWIVVDGCQENKLSPAVELLDEAEANSRLVLLSHPHLDHVHGLDKVRYVELDKLRYPIEELE